MRRPLTRIVRFVLTAGLALPAMRLAADVINYRGQLTIDGAPYTGTGWFRFSLLDAGGIAVWNSGEMQIAVNAGRYAARLGDSRQAPAISVAPPAGGAPLRLRIYFSRTGRDWAQLPPDAALAEAPAAPVRPAVAPAVTNADLLAELRAIHGLLAGQSGAAARSAPPPAAAPTVTGVSIAGAPSLGDDRAPVILVEFTDFQCPFCIKFHHDTFAKLKSAYVDSGRVRIVSMQLPLPFHPFAAPAARAAICATAQAKFWPMRESLFDADGQLPADAIRRLAIAAGLDANRIEACLTAESTNTALMAQAASAKAAGIEATPSFVIGRLVDGHVNGVKIIGAQPFENFEAEIRKQLALAGGS